MLPLTGLLLLGSSGLALGAVVGKRAPPVLHEVPAGGVLNRNIPQGLPCKGYVLVNKGDDCGKIAARLGIESKDFVAWNSPSDPDCKGLWADSYACVAVGPLQPNVARDCTRFMAVEPGSSCDSLAVKAEVNINRIFDWNPDVGAECGNLQAGAHACVGVQNVGHDEAVAAAPAGRRANEGTSKDCKLFVPVDRGDTCESLATRYKVDIADVKKLNACRKDLIAGYYACIAPEAAGKAVSEPVKPETKVKTPEVKADETKSKAAETKGETSVKCKVETPVKCKDEAKEKANTQCYALETNVNITVSKAPASTPAHPCGNVGGVSVDAQIGYTHDGAQGAARPPTVDHSLDVVFSQSQSAGDSIQGAARPGRSFSVDHTVNIAAPATPQEAVQPARKPGGKHKC